MRHPMIEVSESRFTTDRNRDGWLRLDQLRGLDQLRELADSTAVELEKADDDQPIIANAAGYAQGVRDAIGWLAGHHADNRLTDLLDIDEDQR